jgi:hypothetical protein
VRDLVAINGVTGYLDENGTAHSKGEITATAIKLKRHSRISPKPSSKMPFKNKKIPFSSKIIPNICLLNTLARGCLI